MKANEKPLSRSSSLVIAIHNDFRTILLCTYRWSNYEALNNYRLLFIFVSNKRHSLYYDVFTQHKLWRLQPVIVPVHVVVSSSIDFVFNSLPIIITFPSKPPAIILMMCKQMTYRTVDLRLSVFGTGTASYKYIINPKETNRSTEYLYCR